MLVGPSQAKLDNYAAMSNSQLRRLARSLGARDDDFEIADECGNADDLKLELIKIAARLKQAASGHAGVELDTILPQVSKMWSILDGH